MKTLLRSIWWRGRGLFRRQQMEAQMAEEMQAHLDVLTEEYVAAGMSPSDARLAARKRFGGLAQLQEQCREHRHWTELDQWRKDAVFVVRSLARARVFSLTVVTMLALGIGITALVFNLTAWILLFSQPYPHPEQLYVVGFKDKHSSSNPYRPAMILKAYQEQTKIFTEYAAVTRDVANVLIDSEPIVVNLLGASEDCFHTLGIQPVLGRGFLPEEFRDGAGNVVVITHAFWRKYLGGSPDVLGRQLTVDRQSCTVIGVLGPRQAFPPCFEGDVYRPSRFELDPENVLAPTVFIIGRLASGTPPKDAEAVLASVKLPTLPVWATAFLSEQQPMLMRLTELARPDTYWVVAVAAVLLYAIACLNGMNLMLVRLLGRRRELSIRLALGGTRWQIARLLALEAATLAVVASAIVALAAHWGYPRLLALLTGEEALRYSPGLTWETGVCIGALTLLASISVSVAPVWRLLESDLQPVMKDGGSAGNGPGMARLRTALIIFQAAFAVVLLAGTGLMMRSFERLHRMDLGFDPVGRVKVVISFPRDFQPMGEARLQLFERLKKRLATLPGVKEVTFGQNTLLIGAFEGTAQVLTPAGTYQSVVGSFVGADHLSATGMVLKKGRWLSGQPGVMESVINETMAKTLFGDEDPIGRSFRLLVSGDYDHMIVGVVGDVRQTVRSRPGMQLYAPSWIYPPNVDTLVLRLARDPEGAFAGLVRRAIYQTEPKLIANTVNTLEAIRGQGMWAEQFAYKVLKLLTGAALVLTVVGLFSIIGYTVDSRMREFGVRLALGAQSSNLHRLVMTRGLSIAAIGIVVGVGGALALTRFMETLLFETTPHDPLVYIAVAGVLLASAALACWLPARRAAAADITTLLRSE